MERSSVFKTELREGCGGIVRGSKVISDFEAFREGRPSNVIAINSTGFAI
jgi:hypothetical protein